MRSSEVKACAREQGADLIGIASMDRFADVPPEKHPANIFPEAASVIVLGRRVLRGSIRGVEEGTSFSSTYGMFGYRWLEDNFLAQTTYDLTIWIEEQGFEAVPLFGYFEEGMPRGVAVETGKPQPNVILDIEHAAQAAGLGEIGFGGFFLTPQYGTRQRLAMILTDAPLDADPVFTPSICADCRACVAACPLDAIDAGKTEARGVAGHARDVAAVDLDICRSCPNGAMLGPGRGARPDRIAAACGRACLVQLEKAGKCGNAFANAFRKRLPWALDSLRRPVTVESVSSAADTGCDKKVDPIGQAR